MRLIPGKTKVQIELFKGISLWDMLVAGIGILLALFVLISSLPGKFYFIMGIGLVFIGLLIRMDTVPNYRYLLQILRHYSYRRKYARVYDDETLKAMSSENAREQLVGMVFKGNKRSQAAAIRKELMKRQQGADAEEAEMVSADNEETAEETSGETAVTDNVTAPLSKKELKELIKKENAILKNKKSTKEEQDAVWLARAQRSAAKKANKNKTKETHVERDDMSDIMPFTAIKDGYIEYGGKYYGAVLEIPPVEFRFFSEFRRENSIVNGLGRVLRNLHGEFSANIVKLERPLIYDSYLDREYKRLDELKAAYINGALSEEELQARVEILYDRIEEIQKLCDQEKVVSPFYYIVLFESDKRQLEMQLSSAMEALRGGELECHRLNDQELAVFLRYTNEIDFDEHEISQIAPEYYAEWAMPQTLDIKVRTTQVNHIITHNARIVAYPNMVNDAWLATVMSMPGTKVVVKCRPMEHAKAVRNLDRSLQELRGQLMATSVDSRIIELQTHIESLSELLATLQGESELLLETNIYVTSYDIAATRANPKLIQPPTSLRANVTGMKKTVRRLYQENGFRLNYMEFGQMQAFIGSQISAWDPCIKDGRGIPSNSLAACYPWVFASVSDVGGMKLGSSDGVPVFLDFFRRDNERINSNMVIIGKSGSGKSYATKDILTNLAADDSKIFILDPENEYTELAGNLHGKFINVGNATQGRINPFQIITALDDDGSGENKNTGSYATHLQFLEEFFRQILPDCDRDAMEYLNSLIDRMYTNFGITDETDLSKLTPADYPIFDDLYDAVLQEFQQTDNEYVRSILRILMNYIAKFSTGGRNANIWNGPSTITTDENFIVFNFQSLLSNRNTTIANAQMLLVLKYVDNEIIKNRDYNLKFHANRKIVVAIDEAHVFIDTKFPVALDFMFQLAKRIRKYNGMQIVITQNIKDFVGSEEIARKSTAIINACQYSFIFALAPNDMQDLCTLYEKAGGINESEQEQITTAARGQAFTILGAASRTSFRVEVPEDVVDMFQNPDYESRYFVGEEGEGYWEDFIGDSREAAEQNRKRKPAETVEQETAKPLEKKHVTFLELSEEEAADEAAKAKPSVQFEEVDASKEPVERKSSIQFEEVDATDEPYGIASEPQNEQVQTSRAAQPAQVDAQSQTASTSSAQPGGTEQMLTQFLEKFSYDSLSAQIRQAVQQQVAVELAKELAARGIDAAQTARTASNSYMPETKADINDTYSSDIDNNDTNGNDVDVDDIDTDDFDIDDFDMEDMGIDNFDTEEAAKPTEAETENADDLTGTENSNPEADDEEDDFFATDTAEQSDTYIQDEKDSDDEDYDEDEDEDDDDFFGGSADSDNSSGSDFDLMGMLTQLADEMDDITPIDVMDAYGEEVVDISLEDLVKYVKKNIYHQK